MIPQRLLFVALLAFASAAHAIVINVDPAGFEPGTDISNAFQGVTLSDMRLDMDGPLEPDSNGVLRRPVAFSPIYAAEGSRASQGQTIFGHDLNRWGDTLNFEFANYAAFYLAEQPHNPNIYWEVLRADFAQPTNFIQLIGGGASNGNYFRFDVWGTEGQHLAECYSSQSAQGAGTCGAISLGGV